MSTYTESSKEPSRKLRPEHVRLLQERAIPVEFAINHGLISIDLGARAALEERNKLPKLFPHLPMHPVIGILIRYQDCLDGIERFRVRSDVTQYTKPGPQEGSHHGEEVVCVPRYICQAGVGVVPYIIEEVFRVAGDITVPLFIVEAPLKALSLSANGFLAIGLGGVLAGVHEKDALEVLDEVVAHPELRRIQWKGRKVHIAFDAGLGNDDAPGNPLVALGAARVWKALSDLGADVWLVQIPYYHPQQSDPEEGRFWQPEDQGPDDFIARNGVEELQKLVDAAVPADPSKRLRRSLQGVEKDDRPEAAGNILRELFVQATLHEAGDAILSAVAGITTKIGIGKKALRETAGEFGERLVRRLNKDEAAWMKKLKRGGSGTARPIRENVELALRNDPGLIGLVAFDEFSQCLVFTKDPPWTKLYAASKSTKAGDPWTDHDDLRLGGYLAERFKLFDVAEKKIRAAVVVVARDRTRHPVRDYLKSLEWDGVPRLESWLVDYFGVEHTDYTRNVAKWWMISAVARVMAPGCQVDHTLVFEGLQGHGKTSALRVLGGEYFSDGDLGDLRSKEAALALQGVWILELAEGEVFSRTSTRALKAFTTKTFDDIIPKFSNLRQRLLRQCVFALTTNDEADYLMDTTGNRRFWPVRCTRIDLDGLRAVRDQLWAEATAAYREGQKWWPVSDEEKILCKDAQDLRQAHDPWEERIAPSLRHLEHVTIGHVLGSILGIGEKDQGRREQLRVSACLRLLGWVEGGRSKRCRPWVRGPEAEPLVPGGEHVRLVKPDDFENDVDAEEVERLLASV